MPGGIGTFEEFFETLTWAALKLHHKPIGILNVAGYFDPLLALLDHAVAEGFLRQKHLNLLITSDDPEALVAAMLERMPAAGAAATDRFRLEWIRAPSRIIPLADVPEDESWPC